MARSLKEIEADIRLLDSSDKADLIRDLIAELDGEPEMNVLESWIQEATARQAELKSGTVKGRTDKEVIERIRKTITNGD